LKFILYCQINIETINEIVDNKINNFLFASQTKTFFKLVKLFNPSLLKLPKAFLAIFEPLLFYCLFFLLAVLNVCIYLFTFHYKTTTVKEGLSVYFLLLLVLIFHELGHSLSSKKYNIDVKEIGFGLYYILPVFYVNLNEVWKLDKKKRILINLSGMFFQLIAGLFIFLLCQIFKNQEKIFMSLFMVNFIIIVLNLNPFLKFDGYWIVSDLLNENNLSKTSNEIMKNIFRFKKNLQKPIFIFYAISRFLFILWVIFVIFRSFYLAVRKIILHADMEWYNYLPLVIFLIFSYKLFTNYLNKKK